LPHAGLIKRKDCSPAIDQFARMTPRGGDFMRSKNCFRVLTGLTFLAAIACATTAGAQTFPTQPAQSYCLVGGGGLMNRCGFATFEQCKEYSANFGVCNESPRAADQYWIDQTPYARMGKPRRH
jgi:hypothetical protein